MGIKKKAEENIKSGTAAGILFVLLLAIYGFSLAYPFHYDDWKVIVNNESIRYAGTMKNVLLSEASRPLTILTFALNYAFSGTNPACYRVVNILLHFFNSLFLYFILTFFTDSYKKKISPYAAVISAGVFLAHPVQIEAVTYISSRSELLFCFFSFASFLIFLKAANRERFRLLTALSVVIFIFALVSKERAVMYPFVAGIFFALFPRNFKKNMGRIYAYLSLCLIADLLYVLYRFTFAASFEVRTAARTYIEQAKGAVAVLLIYVRMLFLPFNQNIDHTVNVPSGTALVKDLFMIFVLIFLTALIFRKRDKYFFLFPGIIIFILPLIPNLLIPIEDLMTERWMYMSVAGLSFVILQAFVSIGEIKRIGEKILFGILIFFIILSCGRNAVWSDEVSLWNDAAKKSPQKARPLNNMAYVHIQRGEYEKARDELAEAIRREPGFAQAYFNFGTLFSKTGNGPKAVEFYKKSFELDKGFKGAPVNIGVIVARETKDYASAERWFKYALSFDEDFIPALENLAELYYATKRFSEAGAYFAKLKKIGVKNREFEIKAANSCRRAGNLNEAMKLYREYIKKYGESVEALSGMAKISFSRGENEKAYALFKRVTEINPKTPEAYGNIALILLKNGKKEEAIENLEKVILLNPSDSRARNLKDTILSEMREEQSKKE